MPKAIDLIKIHITHLCPELTQSKVQSRTILKTRSHGAICSACDSRLYMRFLWNCSHGVMGLDAICNKVQWIWMRFVINRTSQSHRMGVVPIHVQCHTHHCIACRANRTIWTLPFRPTQSNLWIAVAHKKIAPCERAFKMIKVVGSH